MNPYEECKCRFHDLPYPDEWSILQNQYSGLFTVVALKWGGDKLTAIQVLSLIKCYWTNEGVDLEQHRQAYQATRSPAPAQPSAGDPGGAPTGVHTRYLAARAAANQAASQRAGVIIFRRNTFTGNTVTTTGATLAGGLGPYAGPQPPLPKAEPKVGEIIGHRCWHCVQGQLESVAVGTRWPFTGLMQDVEQASNRIGDHNQYGVWAFKDPYRLAGQFAAYMDSVIFGTVWLWGTVIEHEHGYRAQYARVRSLDFTGKRHVVLNEVRKAYGLKEVEE